MEGMAMKQSKGGLRDTTGNMLSSSVLYPGDT